MIKEKLTGQDIASVLEKKKFKVKNVTKTSLQILVTGNRLDYIPDLIKIFQKQKATYNKNVAGSSIGAVFIDGVKLFIKADGRTGGLDVELAAIQDLQSALTHALLSNKGPITVSIGAKKIKGVAGVQKTPGTPKSDFNLCDVNGKALIHISHKKGSKATDFQQWGGITEPRVAKHKEVLKFISQCQMLYGDQIGNGESAFKKIKSSDLKMMAIFGVDFDSSVPNENRVDVLIQGDPGLKQKSKGVFELTATGNLHYHGEIPTGGFEPVLSIIYKGDRDQGGIKGARISIYPNRGRSFKTEIK